MRKREVPKYGRMLGASDGHLHDFGNICRGLAGFCAVPSGKPLGPPEQDEPERVAEAAERMGFALPPW